MQQFLHDRMDGLNAKYYSILVNTASTSILFKHISLNNTDHESVDHFLRVVRTIFTVSNYRDYVTN